MDNFTLIMASSFIVTLRVLVHQSIHYMFLHAHMMAQTFHCPLRTLTHTAMLLNSCYTLTKGTVTVTLTRPCDLAPVRVSPAPQGQHLQF